MQRNWLALVIAMLVVGVAPAFAGFTPIGGSGEADINTNLNTIYGSGVGNADFSPSGVGLRDWTNGTITFTRVEDYDGDVLVDPDDRLDPGALKNNLLYDGLTGTDQEWTDGIASFNFRLRIAAFNQRFGYDLDSAGANGGWGTTATAPDVDVEVFNSVTDNFGNPSIYKLTDDGSENKRGGFDIDGDFRWARSGRRTNDGGVLANPQSSRALFNMDYDTDIADHMITYRVTGLPDQGDYTVWLLLWDDQGAHLDGVQDRDFNDLWVEVRAIPAPGAVLLAMMGAGAITQFRRRRENRA